MKKILTICTGLLMVAGMSFAQANVEDIVSKHIAAIGGAENWKKINTVVSEGSMDVMGNAVDIKVSQENNKGTRVDITVAGMANYTLLTNKSGWIYMPIQGQSSPEPMPEEAVKEGLDDLDLQGSLVDYKAKGHSVELLGTEDLEGTECYKIKVTRKNSGEQTLFIDKDSYMVLRSVQKIKAMGQETQQVSDFSDYKEVNGVKIPFSLSQGMGTIVMSSVKINEPIDSAVFADPK
jgi:hypothetical protein